MSSDDKPDKVISSDGEAANLEAPKIAFPCSYPIKIIGVAGDNFKEEVIAAVEIHTGKLAAELIDLQPSKKKNYLSVRLTITATGEEQLIAIFADLKAIPNVKLVL